MSGTPAIDLEALLRRRPVPAPTSDDLHHE
jgi:hypothetical protein